MRVNRFRAGCGPITARLTFGIYGTPKVPAWQYFCVISPLWISRFTGFWLKNNRGDLEDIWSAVHALDLWLKPAFRNRLQHGKLPGHPHRGALAVFCGFIRSVWTAGGSAPLSGACYFALAQSRIVSKKRSHSLSCSSSIHSLGECACAISPGPQMMLSTPARWNWPASVP